MASDSARPRLTEIDSLSRSSCLRQHGGFDGDHHRHPLLPRTLLSPSGSTDRPYPHDAGHRNTGDFGHVFCRGRRDRCRPADPRRPRSTDESTDGSGGPFDTYFLAPCNQRVRTDTEPQRLRHHLQPRSEAGISGDFWLSRTDGRGSSGAWSLRPAQTCGMNRGPPRSLPPEGSVFPSGAW